MYLGGYSSTQGSYGVAKSINGYNGIRNAVLAINPVIYAEVSIRFERVEDLEEALPPDLFERLPIPWEAAFLAGKFPEEHAAWASAVPLFWPRPTPGGPRSSRFERARVSLNREWRTAAALPLLAALLLALPHLRRALGL